MKKVFAFLTAAALILCVWYFGEKFGNPFYMSYVLNSAKRICRNNYNGMLSDVGYSFDKENDKYTVDITDQNGIRGKITYSKKDGIENSYVNDYESVCRNIVRGRFQQLLSQNGLSDVSCWVSVVCDKNGVIGDSGGHCADVRFEFGKISDKKEFAEKIVAVYNAVKSESFDTFNAVCVCEDQYLIFETNKNNVSQSTNDIYQRISVLSNYDQ